MNDDTGLDELESNLLDIEPAKAPKKKAAPEAIAKNTIKILLEESDEIPPNGLFLQHNGRPYLLRTGMEVDIPLFLKEILDHAVITVPQVDPTTKQVTGWRSRQKYAYRVIT
jgi:hypothetical protein